MSSPFLFVLKRKNILLVDPCVIQLGCICCLTDERFLTRDEGHTSALAPGKDGRVCRVYMFVA